MSVVCVSLLYLTTVLVAPLRISQALFRETERFGQRLAARIGHAHLIDDVSLFPDTWASARNSCSWHCRCSCLLWCSGLFG